MEIFSQTQTKELGKIGSEIINSFRDEFFNFTTSPKRGVVFVQRSQTNRDLLIHSPCSLTTLPPNTFVSEFREQPELMIRLAKELRSYFQNLGLPIVALESKKCILNGLVADGNIILNGHSFLLRIPTLASS